MRFQRGAKVASVGSIEADGQLTSALLKILALIRLACEIELHFSEKLIYGRSKSQVVLTNLWVSMVGPLASGYLSSPYWCPP